MIDLAPGQELDALVAEKIFGHKVIKGKHFHFIHIDEWYLNEEFGEYLPPYSTSIENAWTIVEKLKMTVSAPGAPYASGEYANSSETEWECEVTKIGKEWSDSVYVRASTAPHAICLAALKAIENRN